MTNREVPHWSLVIWTLVICWSLRLGHWSILSRRRLRRRSLLQNLRGRFLRLVDLRQRLLDDISLRRIVLYEILMVGFRGVERLQGFERGHNGIWEYFGVVE